MNLSITHELEKLVEETVASGRFRSASEVVRNSLRMMEEEERWKAYARAKIAKGMEDVEAGRTISGEDFRRELAERRLKRA